MDLFSKTAHGPIVPYKNNLCSKYAEKMISIKVNNRCNCNCAFCIDVGAIKIEKTDINMVISSALSLKEYQKVIITGGEPFLDFGDVIQLAKGIRAQKKHIALNTNGSLITEETVGMLNPLIDELQVSIHHYTESKNAKVFGKKISFENIKNSVKNKNFVLSINSCLTNSYSNTEKQTAVEKMIALCKSVNADKLRLTELKRVGEEQYVSALEFFDQISQIYKIKSNELITNGCTLYFNDNGVNVSVKRLCNFAKGKNAKAYSCCFIDKNGQKKIDVDTKKTFKVIYSDGSTVDDWISCTKRGV